MNKTIKIGIIICDRYNTCAGGKCFRALHERQGAFSIYQDDEIELVGYTTCNGCPGGNIEFASDEMKKNGAEVIHFATGLVVDYPPCPYINYFRDFIQTKYGLQVIFGTHPVPEKYYKTHKELGTWIDPEWNDIIETTLTNKKIRLSYH